MRTTNRRQVGGPRSTSATEASPVWWITSMIWRWRAPGLLVDAVSACVAPIDVDGTGRRVLMAFYCHVVIYCHGPALSRMNLETAVGNPRLKIVGLVPGIWIVHEIIRPSRQAHSATACPCRLSTGPDRSGKKVTGSAPVSRIVFWTGPAARRGGSRTSSISEGGTMNCKRDRFRSGFVVKVSVILASWLAAGAVQAPAQEGLSHAEDPALSPRLKRIDQDKLLLGQYTLREVIENGRHLFTTPFTKAEGYGEGGKPDGQAGF